MAIYVGYITTKKPEIDDLAKLALYTPGPKVQDTLCDTQFIFGMVDDLYYAIYQIRLKEGNASEQDHMYFVCDDSVYGTGEPSVRDYIVRGLLTEFYTNFGAALYSAEIPNDPTKLFKIEGLKNKELSSLMAQMARATLRTV